MIEQRSPASNIDLSALFGYFWKWRLTYLMLAVIAVAASAFFSGPNFIKPLYKSTVILYPTSGKSISRALLAENPGATKDILEFGEDEQTEQMLQLLNSNLIRDQVIEKYNLMEHYDIDQSTYKYTRLYDKYENRVSFKRTEYMAVQITVLDKDPVIAANIANDIAELLDSTVNLMQKEVALKAFHIVETEYFQLRDEVKSMEDSLSLLRSKGVHDYESQSEMINRQLAIELAKGNTAGVRRLEDKLDTLAKYGGAYVSIRDALEHEKKQLSFLKSKYEEAKVDAEESLPHKFVVNSAYVAEKKSYPIRWLIVLVSLLATLFIATLAIVVVERSGLSSLKKKTVSMAPVSPQNTHSESDRPEPAKKIRK